jgi:serine/threonine protein kinase
LVGAQLAGALAYMHDRVRPHQPIPPSPAVVRPASTRDPCFGYPSPTRSPGPPPAEVYGRVYFYANTLPPALPPPPACPQAIRGSSVMHRDLKPDNIGFIGGGPRGRAGHGRPVLIDFGCACVVAREKGAEGRGGGRRQASQNTIAAGKEGGSSGGVAGAGSASAGPAPAFAAITPTAAIVGSPPLIPGPSLTDGPAPAPEMSCLAATQVAGVTELTEGRVGRIGGVAGAERIEFNSPQLADVTKLSASRADAFVAPAPSSNRPPPIQNPARLVEASARVWDLTGQTGAARYMAPEVYLCQPYGLRSETYSFSLVLWHMLTKELPYDGLIGSGGLELFERKVQPLRPFSSRPASHAPRASPITRTSHPTLIFPPPTPPGGARRQAPCHPARMAA